MNRVWTYAAPGTALLGAGCLAALVSHEARGGLSSTAMLFVQAGVLAGATVLAGGTAVQCAAGGQQGRGAKGAVMGCAALVWTMGLLGFARAAAVWAAAGGCWGDEEEDGTVDLAAVYGTFRPMI